MFKLKNKVKILSGQKTDGRFNYGKIVGVEVLQKAYYLGYVSEKEFMSRFDGTRCKYKVAYIDCVTSHATVEEFYQSELEKA